MAGRRAEAVDKISKRRVSAIIRTNDQAIARDAMAAAVDGGIRIVEFTCTTPGVFELITEFSAHDGILVGAGTVMDAKTAERAVSAGAEFLVSPITDSEIIGAAHDLDAACIPGAYTPTEMETAHRAGADFIKVFPAPPGGVDFIRALRGPLPHHRLFPTAGPTPDNFLEYLEAGCAGVGFVRSLFVPDDLSAGRFEAIRKRASGIIERLTAWQTTSGVS